MRLSDFPFISQFHELVGDKMSGEFTTECTNENNEKRVTFATDNEKANMKGMKMST